MCVCVCVCVCMCGWVGVSVSNESGRGTTLVTRATIVLINVLTICLDTVLARDTMLASWCIRIR